MESATVTSEFSPSVQDAFETANNEVTRIDFDALASDVLNESRVALMMQFRFLDVALWHMEYRPAPIDAPLGTDGKEIVMNSSAVLARFQDNSTEIIRDYLHLILHCIFRHPFDKDHLSVSAWSLASDIIVESVAMEMCDTRFKSPDDLAREQELQHLENLLGKPLSPIKLYKCFAQAEAGASTYLDMGFNAAYLWDLRLLFARDSHDGWANMHHDKGNVRGKEKDDVRRSTLSDELSKKDEDNEKDDVTELRDIEEELDNDQKTPEIKTQPSDDDQKDNQNQQDDEDDVKSFTGDEDSDEAYGMQDEQDEQDSQNGQGLQGESEQDGQSAVSEDGSQDNNVQQDGEDDSQSNSSAQSSGEGQENDSTQNSPDDEQEGAQYSSEEQQEWREIAVQMELDLQSFSRGNGSKALMANLAIANVAPCDYKDFLRKFSALGEDMKVNDDEFDYIYYTFGMDMYGNMPLVEPLEYKETNRIREFVVALDTSGSCSGELIKTFVGRTYDILRESEGFGDKVNLHIIQCDNKIQTDLKITRTEDLEKYTESFQVFGFGGTDFQPVFEYVDKLVEAGEFENLRGLIYFTDGLGTFPKNPPEYETAFVFVNDGTTDVRVPPWAMKVVLDEDKILTL